MIRPHYKGIVIHFLVFDLTNRKSFDCLSTWRDEFLANGNKDAIPILIGNKVDLVEERSLSLDMCREYAELNNMIYIETSTKTGQGMDAIAMVAAEAAFNEMNSGLLAKNLFLVGIKG